MTGSVWRGVTYESPVEPLDIPKSSTAEAERSVWSNTRPLPASPGSARFIAAWPAVRTGGTPEN